MSNDIVEIKSRIDIVDFISRYLTLRKTGINYSGLCPFHQEQTPSFMVNGERQSFKCFGCNEGGDVIDFFMKIEGLEFSEALKTLAEQAGVTLSKIDHKGTLTSDSVDKNRLFSLNRFLASAWYQILLKHPAAETARNYLKKERGIESSAWQNWQIGFAPPHLISQKLLRKKGFSEREQESAGNPIRLSGRLVFPIFDLVGKVVGFTGRVLPGSDQNGPKYWNTPATPIFHKGRVLYGLDKAKAAIRKDDLALLVEGQMDTIALHQAGYQIAIATSGTALTTEHLKIIKRFTANLALAFDQDQAGQDAAERVIELAFKENINPSLIITPVGKDPAEAVIKDPTSWQASFSNRRHFLDWLIEQSLKKNPENDSGDKKKVTAEILPWIGRIQTPVERSYWIRQLAERLSISEKSLEESLSQIPQDSEVEITSTPSLDDQEKETDLAVLLIGLMSRFPALIKSLPTDLASFLKKPESEIVQKLQEYDDKVFFPDFLGKIDNQWQKIIADYHLISTHNYPSLSANPAQAEIFIIIKRIKSQSRDKIKAEFAQAIAQAEKSGDIKKAKKLLERLQHDILKK